MRKFITGLAVGLLLGAGLSGLRAEEVDPRLQVCAAYGCVLVPAPLWAQVLERLRGCVDS